MPGIADSSLVLLGIIILLLLQDPERDVVQFCGCMIYPFSERCRKYDTPTELDLLNAQADAHVFILHGLGERTWTMKLFKSTMEQWGWKKVHLPHWPANTCLLEDCLDALDREMQLYANKSEPIFVIGNSMGGVMAYHLHTRGWNITASYSVASPIKGSEMYRWLKETMPAFLFNFFQQPGHLYLERTDQPPPPPHPWFTIGYNFAFGFDGNVFLSDMPSENHRTFPGIHYSLSLDLHTWSYLNQQMKKYSASTITN